MKQRTLLLLSYHFPPSAASGSFRLLGFARHLSAYGWRTVVVAPPSMPSEPVDEALRRQIPRETLIYPVPMPRGNRLTRRLAPFAAWLPAALKSCGRAIHEVRPDAVLSSSPPHTIHLLGYVVKLRYGLPWIVDYRDPWIFGHSRPVRRTWAASLETLKEKAVLRAADAIVTNTPGARAALVREVPECGSKTRVITNGFDPESFTPQWEAKQESSHLVLLHTGELYAGRDPRPLFDALMNLHHPAGSKPLRMTFLGQSSDPRHDWPGEARRRGLEHCVRFADHVPYDQALRQILQADILVLMDAPGRRVGIPAKLFEYFGARKPILALAELQGDVAWALRVSGVRYRLAPPGDSAQIRSALSELVDAVASPREMLAEPVPKMFTRAHMAGQLVGLLDPYVESETSAAELVSLNGLHHAQES